MIAWVIGPKSRFNTGVAKYSFELIDGLKAGCEKKIRNLYYEDGGHPNSLGRYIWQFVFLPIITLIKYNRCDYVIYQEAFAFLTLFRLFSKKKTVVIIHHVPEVRDNSLKGLYLKAVFFGLKFNTKVCYLTPSEFTKGCLSKYYGIDKDKIFEISNIIKEVDPNVYELDCALSRDEKDFIEGILNYKNQGYKVVSNVGSFEARKNVLILPKVIKGAENDADNIVLVKVGVAIDENIENEFKKECHSFGIHSMIYGAASNEMISKVYQLTDVYLAPSTYEGFGRTIIEAQANSSVVIASDIAAHREITHGSAILIKDIHDIEKWVAELVRILTSERHEIDELIVSGVANSKLFSPECVIKKLAKIL
ncbi:TPA: glycosyltransferase family 4 protein [Serratia marcescens]|nr:glycosyltransferase family 4 protein [Serratia marcescens]